MELVGSADLFQRLLGQDIVRAFHSWIGLAQVRTAGGVAGDEHGGNYTAVMIVTDRGTPRTVVSRVEFTLNVIVNPKVSVLGFCVKPLGCGVVQLLSGGALL